MMIVFFFAGVFLPSIETFDVNEAYRGCYGELSGNYTRFENVTNVGDCLTICKGKKHILSLIKSASECFCSDHLPSTSSPSSQCSLKCFADDNPCGSSQLYSVYYIKIVEKATKKYLGCYKDAGNKDLSQSSFRNNKMTIELCLETCLKNGFSYSGLQDTSECYCGNSYGKHGKGDNCDRTCPGNKDQKCGGIYRNSIYEACYTYDGVLDTCSPDLHHCSGGSPPSVAGECGSCEDGWKPPTCLLRDCSVNNGGCGIHKCEEYSVGEVETNECVCNEGYFKKSYNDQCQDIDECNTLTNKCRQNISTCINIQGSYTCNCSIGFENEDSITCRDINECDRNTDTCERKIITCINNDGSYRCDCLVGYEYNENKKCIDIDECDRNQDTCDQKVSTCINIAGSYTCNCSVGYENIDSKTCRESDVFKVVMIGGVVVGVVVGLIVLLLVLLFFMRDRVKAFVKRKLKKPNFDLMDSSGNTENDIVTMSEVEPEQGTRIKLKNLQQFMQTEQQKINDQFASCPKDFGDSKIIGSDHEMIFKNRFRLIFPYDHNRVTLNKNEEDVLSHYINASFVDSYETVKAYSFIAAQGPKKETIEDFWRMVVQFSVSVVVMLTKCVEQGSTKCEQYWPESGSQRYGSLTVTLIEFRTFLYAEKRIFKVQNIENGIELTTHHLLFTDWPDKSVPQNAMSLLNLRSLMLHLFNLSSNGRNYNDSEEDLPNYINPNMDYIVVHCSAGVGRTGTFIALDNLVNEALHRDSVDVFETLKQLRKQRCLMIQTKTQYELCHKCMYMYYMLGEDTLLRLQEKQAFEKKMIGLRKIERGVCMIKKQFKIIDDETETNIVKAVDRSQIELSSGKLDAVSSSSATKHSKYVVGVAPNIFSKQDVFTLLSGSVGVLVLIDSQHKSMKELMSSLQDCSGLKSDEETVSFACQVRNVVGHVMYFKIGNVTPVLSSMKESEQSSYNEAVWKQMKKVIHLRSVRHDVIQKLHYLIKKEDKDTVVMVLSRHNYDDASVSVAALNVAESIETSRTFDVFQIAFEMRFSQPTCLSRINLFEKLYDMAGKLVESLSNDDGNYAGDLYEEDEGYAEYMRNENKKEKRYEWYGQKTNNTCVIPSTRGTMLYQNFDSAYINNQESSIEVISDQEENVANRPESMNPDNEVDFSKDHVYANT